MSEAGWDAPECAPLCGNPLKVKWEMGCNGKQDKEEKT